MTDLNALADLRTPWCLRVAVTLNVAEHMHAGAASVEDLAALAECDPDALHRVLAHLASVGVFEPDGPGRFVLNDPARSLLRPGTRLFMDLDGLGGRFAMSWTTLLSAVRTGRCAYDEAFGRSFFDDLDAHPHIAAQFDALMGPTGHGTPDPNVLLTRPWDEIRTVVDVGGGTGSLLAEILRAHPHLHGTLVELPGPAGRSREIFEAAGVADRASVVAQSFFDALPSGADLYVLSGVVNDWPDDDAVRILRRCAEAMTPQSRLAVRGGVASQESDDLRIGPDMLVSRGLGGKPRTLDRFGELAREAGLEVSGAERRQGLVVECRLA